MEKTEESVKNPKTTDDTTEPASEKKGGSTDYLSEDNLLNS